jgi:hypothetical protein
MMNAKLEKPIIPIPVKMYFSSTANLKPAIMASRLGD